LLRNSPCLLVRQLLVSHRHDEQRQRRRPREALPELRAGLQRARHRLAYLGDATLSEPDLLDAPVVLRPLRFADARAWYECREANASWLSPWNPTSPEAPASRARTGGCISVARSIVRRSPLWPYVSMARKQRAGRRGGEFLWLICYGGEVVGQLTVWRITWGSNRSAELGYWIDERFAGRGITPTALAMVVDHCFLVMGMHRLVASIRPENAASRRVVEKLGFRNEGTRVGEVHIDGAWRDHICYAITAEEVSTGMLARWRGSAAVSRSGTR
jgi:ribosomal-protein-alanine N-acetyltransferase